MEPGSEVVLQISAKDEDFALSAHRQSLRCVTIIMVTIRSTIGNPGM
jgi:hypothetical protein